MMPTIMNTTQITTTTGIITPSSVVPSVFEPLFSDVASDSVGAVVVVISCVVVVAVGVV